MASYTAENSFNYRASLRKTVAENAVFSPLTVVPVCGFNIRELKEHASSGTNKNGEGNCFEGGG
jgi:hypothetical protein